jgi:hypothetical protein
MPSDVQVILRAGFRPESYEERCTDVALAAPTHTVVTTHSSLLGARLSTLDEKLPTLARTLFASVPVAATPAACAEAVVVAYLGFLDAVASDVRAHLVELVDDRDALFEFHAVVRFDDDVEIPIRGNVTVDAAVTYFVGGLSGRAAGRHLIATLMIHRRH